MSQVADTIAPATPPAPQPAEGPDPFEAHTLVVDNAPAATPAAAAAPAPVTPAAPAAEAAPVVPPPPLVTPPVTPAAAETPAPPAPGMDKATQKLQQDMGVLVRTVMELQEQLLAAKAATPPTPTAAPAAEPDELEQMLADTYEIDVSADPKKLAKHLLQMKKAFTAELAAVKTEARAEVAARVQQAQVQDAGQREYERLQQAHPEADLAALFQEARQQATTEGYDILGEPALLHRAGQIWQARLAAPKPAAAAAVPPTPAAAPKPAAPTPPSPGGASVRVPTVGGNPVPPASAVPTEDEIYERHTLVRNS